MSSLDNAVGKEWNILIMGSDEFHEGVSHRLDQVLSDTLFVTDHFFNHAQFLGESSKDLSFYDAFIVSSSVVPKPPKLQERKTEETPPCVELYVGSDMIAHSVEVIPPDLLSTSEDGFYEKVANAFSEHPLVIPGEKRTMYVVLGLSGAGKGTTAQAVVDELQKKGLDFERSRRILTRPKRIIDGEVSEDTDIEFVSVSDFKRLENDGKVVSYKLYNYRYGFDLDFIRGSSARNGLVHISGCGLETVDALREEIGDQFEVVPLLLYTDEERTRERQLARWKRFETRSATEIADRLSEIHRTTEQYREDVREGRFAHVVYSEGDEDHTTSFGIRRAITQLRRIIEYDQGRRSEGDTLGVGSWHANEHFVISILQDMYGVGDVNALGRAARKGGIQVQMSNEKKELFAEYIDESVEYVDNLLQLAQPVRVTEAYGRVMVWGRAPSQKGLAGDVMRNVSKLIEFQASYPLSFAGFNGNLGLVEFMDDKEVVPYKNAGLMALTDIAHVDVSLRPPVQVGFGFLHVGENMQGIYPKIIARSVVEDDPHWHGILPL